MKQPPSYAWVIDEDGTVIALERSREGSLSYAAVIDGKLDTMFRVNGPNDIGIAIVPESYGKDYKKWLKSWTLNQRSETRDVG